jgi:hypothetical protein
MHGHMNVKKNKWMVFLSWKENFYFLVLKSSSLAIFLNQMITLYVLDNTWIREPAWEEFLYVCKLQTRQLSDAWVLQWQIWRGQNLWQRDIHLFIRNCADEGSWVEQKTGDLSHIPLTLVFITHQKIK